MVRKNMIDPDDEEAVIRRALQYLEVQAKQSDALTHPSAVRSYLRLAMHGQDHESFWIVLLDTQHHVIAFERMFRGTISQTTVHPREVVRIAMKHNAYAVILAHNHPSGNTEPSAQDQWLTRQIIDALAMVDVKVLDHFIVAPGACLSFAERGLL